MQHVIGARAAGAAKLEESHPPAPPISDASGKILSGGPQGVRGAMCRETSTNSKEAVELRAVEERAAVFSLPAAPAPGPQTPNGGPGACVSVSHSARAALVQTLATALSFGLKPFVETLTTQSAERALAALRIQRLKAPTVAMILGGIFVGAVHSLAGSFAAGTLNHALGVRSYSLREGSEFERQAQEFISTSLPVYVYFTLAYAMRGGLAGTAANPWTAAASRSFATCLAAACQGFTTDMIKQAWTSAYESSPAGAPEEQLQAALNEVLRPNSQRALHHDWTGKIAGGVLGNALATYGARPLSPGAQASARTFAMQGARGMMLFLTGWFAGIHGGAAVGSAIDSGRRMAATAQLDAIENPVNPVADRKDGDRTA